MEVTPRPGMMWRHVILSTRRSWLHGDPRGFRSRKHRIHSSGDYRNPPRAGEHSGLLDYQRRRAKGARIKIPKSIRAELGKILVNVVVGAGVRLLVIAVGRYHAHLLPELPIDPRATKRVVGKWKCARSAIVRDSLPGSIWGAGGKYKPVKTRSHLRAAFKYIRDDQGPGAWVWTIEEPVPTAPVRAMRRDGRALQGKVKRPHEGNRARK